MKKMIVTMLCVIMLTSLMACSGSPSEEEVRGEQKEEHKESPDFADKEWLFYDEGTAEHLCLNLRSDGSFSYHCQCGEPVGDSDLYDEYTYDAETGVITLSNDYDDATDEIKVLDYNEYHLMVEIEDEIKDFCLFELDTTSNFYSQDAQSYLEGYESRCTVVDIADGKIVYGPVNYDPEGPYAEGPFIEYEMSENVPVFDMHIQRYISIRNEQEYEELYDVSFTEIGQEEIGYILDAGAGAAFLWFDNEQRVEKIVFYGENSMMAQYESITILPEDTETKVPEEYEVSHENWDGSIIYLMNPEQYKNYLK